MLRPSFIAPPVLQSQAASVLSPQEQIEVAYLMRWMGSLGIVDDGHFPRVMFLTLALCERLNALNTPAERQIALRAGLLHDIGKALVAENILSKCGPLNDEERVAIEKHPEFGARLALNLKDIEPEVIKAILHHHEAYNGEGYPYGLSGLQIPRLARVLSVADVYDALTNARPYRVAWTHTEAMVYLKKFTGTLFDPLSVWALDTLDLDPLHHTGGKKL
ncbi:HD domain-containing protein (plasmid) [Deinococcus sp. KNUC1210]|uniref:HD-GYP domain-containing protein n=1 Tax=Deinococcus sp. KNUC1210 TaxID=2917691 RepID=UPI001EEFFAE4|nr:HD domain-containing phosphohydrolase [Deinococcus sp. KNUC1210]ULH18102.1 HD domain-containing protein [Deinococcus sp. KNUC1210]